MDEKLIQFIWLYRYYSYTNLFTTTGNAILVRKTGSINLNQGPDFLGAQIQIDQINWVGNIEVHIKSSDFTKHKHQDDARYQQLILHVVWEDDLPLKDAYGNRVPTLELANLVPKILLNQYQVLMNATQKIPCETLLASIDDWVWRHWKEKLIAERFLQRTAELNETLKQVKGNWDLLIWALIAKYMGGKVNGDLFVAIIYSVPYKVWKKYSYNSIALEGLLMGQAGLLSQVGGDDFYQQLKREYKYLQYKYQLEKPKQPAQFLRMRPASFPTLRLSQLAEFMQKNPSLLSFFKQAHSIKAFQHLFTLTASGYWNTHYLFGETSGNMAKKTGNQLQYSLIINVVVRVLHLYGKTQNSNRYATQALQLLTALSAEQNKVLRIWAKNGILAYSAFDSQALIQLYENYCIQKKCLQCSIGNAILQKSVLKSTS